MNLEVGQKLKRKFKNYDIVTIYKINGDTVTIKDKNGFKHPLDRAKMEKFFEELEPDELISTKTNEIDNTKKHNIAGPMNRPSRDQEFNKDK